MLRPSGQRKIPPLAIARCGASLRLSTYIIPLTRWTSRSPATPVPYSFQQRQRAKILGLNGTLGTVPCQVFQSRFSGESPGGGGYSQAPLGSLRPNTPSTIIRSPSVSSCTSSRALVSSAELTRCEPTCTRRPVFFSAETISTPSEGLWDIGF